MSRKSLSLRLRRVKEQEEITWVSFSGPVLTVAAASQMEALITALGRWCDGSLRVALSANDDDAWRERWEAVLAFVPKSQIELRVRRRLRTGAAPKVDNAQLMLFGTKKI